MSAFHTEFLTPDKQDKISLFFRVLAPSLIWTILVVFFRSYYAQNGYPYPFILGNIMVWITLFSLPLLMLYLWYHSLYYSKGTLDINDSELRIHWEDPAADFNYPISELKNLSVVYDGFPSAFGPYKGTENLIKFNYKGEDYAYNFRLNNEEHASDLAKTLRTWYEKGVRFTEANKNGDETYLLFYHPANKTAIA